MAATPAWRESPFAPPAWCAISATSPTRRKNCRRKSRRKDLRPPDAQSIEAGGIGAAIGPAGQSLHMLDLGRRSGEEKEGAAGLRIIAPHFRGAVLAGEGGRPGQSAQLRGLKPGEDIRFAWRWRRRNRHGGGCRR